MKRESLLSPDFPKTLRLGLATRGNTHLSAEEVCLAVDRGINFLNWCGYEDGMSRAVRGMGKKRSQVVLATQIQATGGEEMGKALDAALSLLGSDYLDVVTFYYLETQQEWDDIRGPGGALERLRKEKEEGRVRCIGITSHQRRLAASIAQRGEVDLLMIRYNAAHRGAETEVFPVTDLKQIPVIAYTCLRWGALIRPLNEEEGNETVPSAVDCYRYVLSNPSVDIALMAPDDRKELVENLSLLEDWRALTKAERARFDRWGDQVHQSAGAFP